jgi:hypothetical protein
MGYLSAYHFLAYPILLGSVRYGASVFIPWTRGVLGICTRPTVNEGGYSLFKLQRVTVSCSLYSSQESPHHFSTRPWNAIPAFRSSFLYFLVLFFSSYITSRSKIVTSYLSLRVYNLLTSTRLTRPGTTVSNRRPAEFVTSIRATTSRAHADSLEFRLVQRRHVHQSAYTGTAAEALVAFAGYEFGATMRIGRRRRRGACVGRCGVPVMVVWGRFNNEAKTMLKEQGVRKMARWKGQERMWIGRGLVMFGGILDGKGFTGRMRALIHS